MNKLIATIAVAIATFSCAFAQIKLGAPKAPQSGDFTAQSSSVTYDSSLLKAVVFFDGLDSSYGALNYDIGQLDGLFKNPLRFGFSAAMKDEQRVWGGPSVSYELYNNNRIALGLIGAMPGLTMDGNKFSWAKDTRVVWGATFSFKFGP